MNKILTLLCVISIILGLCACSSQQPVETVPVETTAVATTIATTPTTPAETVHPLYIAVEDRSFTPADYVGDIIINLNPGTICSEFPDGSGQVIELEVGGEYIVNGYSFPLLDSELMKIFSRSPKYTAEDGRIFFVEVIPVDKFVTLGAAEPIPWSFAEGIILHIADENGMDLGYVSTEDRPFVSLNKR